MRSCLIVVGLFVLSVALRSARKALSRKLGALVFLVASFMAFYFITGRWCGGLIGVVIWFFLPWVELLTRIRRMRLPLENRLRHRSAPDPSFFPNAAEAAAAMEEAGFEHVDDCGWEWGGMQQYFRLFWHPEERAVGRRLPVRAERRRLRVHLGHLARQDGPDSGERPISRSPRPSNARRDIRWNHVPCERNCFHQILADHHAYLRRLKIEPDSLRVPDPEEIESAIEAEMKSQIRHNLEAGIIRETGDGHFEYTFRGLLFLWGQFVKDMVRLC